MNDPYFIDFVRSRDYREATIKVHRISLRDYCNLLGKTPTQIIDEAEKEEDEGRRMKRRSIKRYFLDFVDHLKSTGNSERTIHNKVCSVKTFYHEHEIDTPRVKTPKSSVNPALKKIPDKEDIIEALKYCNLRDKAIVLHMSSSGMASAETRNLKYSDFISAIDEYLVDLREKEKFDVVYLRNKLRKKDIVGEWRIVRQKTSMPYITFSTPESIHAILDYLCDNQKNNKGLKGFDDYIFGVNGKKMPDNTLVQIYRRINASCGFGKSGYQRFFVSHSMRRFMATSLEDAGMDRTRVRWLLGHKVTGTEGGYFKMTAEKMKQEYINHMDALSTQTTKTKTIESEEYQYLISNLNDKDQMLHKLEKRLDIMEKEKKVIHQLLSNPEFVKELNTKITTL